jgi:hypothetical protein
MRTATMLVLMLLAIGAASQTAVPSPTRAQCAFSDGSTITVTYSSEHQQFRVSTEETLLMANRWDLPSGDYTVFPEEDSHHQWSLLMRKPIKGREYMPGYMLLSFPMSIATSALPSEQPRISFDETGGSCVMHLRQKPGTLLSLEFAQRGLGLASLQ